MCFEAAKREDEMHEMVDGADFLCDAVTHELNAVIYTRQQCNDGKTMQNNAESKENSEKQPPKKLGVRSIDLRTLRLFHKGAYRGHYESYVITI